MVPDEALSQPLPNILYCVFNQPRGSFVLVHCEDFVIMSQIKHASVPKLLSQCCKRIDPIFQLCIYRVMHCLGKFGDNLRS